MRHTHQNQAMLRLVLEGVPVCFILTSTRPPSKHWGTFPTEPTPANPTAARTDANGFLSFLYPSTHPYHNITYNSIISQISHLAGFLKQSPQWSDNFNTTLKLIYNDDKPTKPTNFLWHVCTRWNSTYDMLVRALILEEAYNKFCSPLNMQSRIEQACHQYNVTPIEPAAKAICKKFTKYLKILITKIPEICATILDPQSKLKFFYTNEATLASLGTSATTFSIMFKDEAQKHFKKSSNPEADLTAQQHVELFDEIYSTSALEVSNLETEVKQFFAEPQEPKSTNIFVFWNSRKSLFHTLGLMANRFLSIPATSRPSERVFSGGRKILTYQRASLSAKHVEQLAFVKSWSCTFDPLFTNE
ncbi:hypothetical protein O181_081388 [Austropuccinia psidii MF-1]|uniref:HAT C-terminal dimerisation domain-containing protein n=1 Tax=Austropuccinia psidii MF-1 TaxID=1389203 RepID=A0A9Q3IHF3_9BASI|nr:hypothetical protein [Austropuccinia psidii MF-1]